MLNLNHPLLGADVLTTMRNGLMDVCVYLVIRCSVVLCNNRIGVFAVVWSRRLAIASNYNSNCLYFSSTEYHRRVTACQYCLFV
jgi:hypothetical protein